MAPTRSFLTNERQHTFWLAAGIGVFVAAFLLVFRPFGMQWHGWQDPAFWVVLGLAPFNTGLILLLDAVFTRLQQRWRWLQHWYGNLFASVALIVIGNVAYQAVLQEGLDGAELLAFTWHVALIALFPTVFIVLYYRQRRRTDDAPALIADANAVFTLGDETHRETLSVPADDLLFITSDRNYALVYTRTSERPHLLRTSLKALEVQLADTSVVRCHRSYLVNTIQVVHRRRHARGLHLTLRGTETTVPVSASFLETIEAYLAP
ncbi:MAG: LytTR family DNA-binding domain-containing protein [Rhodothermales bacterium]